MPRAPALPCGRPVLAPSIILLVALASGDALLPDAAATPGADAPPPAAAATGEAADAPAPPIVAASNEAMEYSVSYLGLPMGKARLFVGNVEPNLAPVFLQAQTSSMLSFVTIRQQLATYLDLDTGLPRSASLDAIEGSYRHTDTVQFDRAANKATVREKGKYDNTYHLDVPPGTIDFVSLVFKLRSLPLEPGMRHEFPVLAGRRLNTVAAEVIARETVSTKLGDFSAVKVRVPTGFTGKFSEKNPTYVWFSDDARRIVVRITSDFAIGHATAGLVAYTPGALPAAASAAP
jgi:hypothetical protein